MRIADYEIIEPDSGEPSGVFHNARPPARLGLTDPIVHLQVLEQFGSPDEFSRVSGELRLLRSLDSPHLVELLEAGSVDGRMYLATRHYPAGSLETAGPTLARSARVAVVADAARGAHAMHEAGVAHRDINPSNIFIDRTRGRLANLGLAQTLAGATSSIGKGPTASLQFLDPDLVWGGRASRATDIWSLGMTLHNTLSDVAPYGEIPTDRLMAAFRHVVQNQPALDQTLEPYVLAVIERCLTPVDDRYDTALELADELDTVSRRLADDEHHATETSTKGPSSNG